MGKIGIQQLSPQMLTEIKQDIIDNIKDNLPTNPGGGSISVGVTPPETSTTGTVWIETGMGAYEGGENVLFIKNAIIIDDEIPEDYDPDKDIIFDLD